ncbi:unnamed protein product [Staurois parvus]|uniref:Uncharacterized protein n=1 Tax=Staurois parvus TaxID=386267 RepID=A0ABN9BUT1_9NEOB|nr:unnamed protein product [Staurois parvus]
MKSSSCAGRWTGRGLVSCGRRDVTGRSHDRERSRSRVLGACRAHALSTYVFCYMNAYVRPLDV